MPQRFQLSRRAGYKKPAGAVVVSRPSKWGNPWRIGDLFAEAAAKLTAEQAVYLYRDALTFGSLGVSRDDVRRELRGKDLACWCALPAQGAEDVCHAAVLLEVANRDP